MASFAVLTEHRWPSGDSIPIVRLHPSAESIATRCRFSLAEWEEDGIGLVRGAILRLNSGRIVELNEKVHLVEQRLTTGPDIFADVDEMAAIRLQL